jgi:hypothetical protein
MNADISNKIKRYSTLINRRDAIDKELSQIKLDLRNYVKLSGDYDDGNHTIKLVVRNECPNYNSGYVEKLFTTWSDSEDKKMRLCAELLEKGRSVTRASEYVLIK